MINLLNQYRGIVDKSSIVSKSDLEGNITYMNDKFFEISGYSYEELIGKPYSITRHPDMTKEVFEELWQTIRDEKRTWNGILKNRRKNGKSYYLDMMISPILDTSGNIIEYIAICHDITDVMDHKRQLLDAIKAIEKPFLFMVQIDDYEMLQDVYYDDIVEALENNFANRVLDYFPKGYGFNKVYRLGNGEFAFVKDTEKGAWNLEIQNRCINEFQNNVKNHTLTINDFSLNVNVNISYSAQKEHLYENVRLGLKEAKNHKLEQFCADNLLQEKHSKAEHNIHMLQIIKSAIEEKRIHSYFQRIYNNRTEEIEKYESLVRLMDEKENILTPFHFLDIAKKGKYYHQITQLVLDNSFAFVQTHGHKVSINISLTDIENEVLRERMISMVRSDSILASKITFELLEDEDANNFDLITDFISRIKSHGASISIDDFGSGYSNFERLLSFQPDYLKIDGSLIKDIVTNRFSRNIVETIQSFAHKQNTKTVAEFVSDEEIFSIVKEMGIDYSQGYFIEKPRAFQISFRKKPLFLR